MHRQSAKPKGRETLEDQPTHEPMGANLKPAKRKAPTGDQKKVRRAMQRSALTPAPASPGTTGPSAANDGAALPGAPARSLPGTQGPPAGAPRVDGSGNMVGGTANPAPTNNAGTPSASTRPGTSVASLRCHACSHRCEQAPCGMCGSLMVTAETFGDSAICPSCYGSGTEGSAQCSECGGTGRTPGPVPKPLDHRQTVAMRKGAPFAGYEDFEDCEEQNSDKQDSAAYCGEIKHRTEDKKTATQQSRNVARSDGTILLNAGDNIRTPTGQSMKVRQVRRHETSPDHYYVDTDAGTTVVPWSTNFDVVTDNPRQQELPGAGSPGGNSNRLPLQGGESEGLNKAPSKCPNCGATGSLRQQGDKFVCSECGFTVNTGSGQSYSDATQSLTAMRIGDTRPALVRGATQMLTFLEEQ